MTFNLDLTAMLKEIKDQDIKLYPAMIYLLTKVVNNHEEFRMAFDEDGRVGIYDFLHPSYTIFQKSTETFTNLWTEYTGSFPEFHKRYESHENGKTLLPISIQVHHAVCDGFHVARFVNELQEAMNAY